MQILQPLLVSRKQTATDLSLMLSSDGFVREIDGTIHVELWLKGRFQKRQRTAFKMFLADCTDKINQHFECRAKPVRISLPDSPPSW